MKEMTNFVKGKRTNIRGNLPPKKRLWTKYDTNLTDSKFCTSHCLITQRVIYDLRKLNSQTVKNLYPIPHIKMLLQRLRNKSHFGLLDLKGTFTS